jgi:hypothetical protein
MLFCACCCKTAGEHWAGRAAPMEFAAFYDAQQCIELLPSISAIVYHRRLRVEAARASVVRGQNPRAINGGRTQLVRAAPIWTLAVPRGYYKHRSYTYFVIVPRRGWRSPPPVQFLCA